MRSFSKSWVASLFLGLIALSFVAWGIGDMFKASIDTNVITVGSTQIPQDVFSRDFRNILNMESQRQRRQITMEEARKAGLADAVADQMVNRALFDGIVSRLGLTVGDDDVAAQIRKLDMFFGPLGTFDKDTYLKVLAQRGYSEDEFASNVRGDIARSELMAPVEAGFTMPTGYAHALFAFTRELRATEYVTVSAQSLGTVPPPGDAVLAAYIKAHSDRFSTPEYRAVSVAVLGPEDMAASIKVTDAQLQKEYEIRKSVYVIPDKRDVQQIAFPDEASAKAARAKVDGGMAFEATAFQAKTQVDTRNGVSQDDLGPLGAQTFALKEGETTQPIKNFSTWVLLHVTKIIPGKTTTFDQAKAELSKSLTERLAQAKIGDMANVYSESRDKGADLAEAAKGAGFRVIKVAAVDAQGLGANGAKTALPADPELVQHIFAADIGEPGDPFLTTSGHTYAVAVEGMTPPKPKSLDAARADATRLWTAEQTAKLLDKRATELANEAKHDGTLANIAKKIGAPVQSSLAISRRKGNETFSVELLKRIYDLPQNGIATGPSAQGNDIIIARVTGIVHPPIVTNSAEFRQGVGQLSNEVGEDIAESLAAQERTKEKVNVNKKLLDQALGGEGGS
jgi:peptidyl-prolyl cis-trans isomerase D